MHYKLGHDGMLMQCLTLVEASTVLESFMKDWLEATMVTKQK